MATSQLGDSLLHFSVDLYKQLVSASGSSENIIYSPFSICAALSTALAGARNTTSKQLADVLHVNSEEVHGHFASFLSKLPGLGPDVKMHVANRMYSEQTFPVLALLRDSYGATIESVDYRKDFEKVRRQVNAWVEQATDSKITELLPSGCVDSLTTLILVNAIYFRGRWNSKFDLELTQRFDFDLEKTNKTEVDMMYKNNDYSMGRSDDLNVSALEIPYRGGKVSMVILLPDDIEGLSQLEQLLITAKLSKRLKSLSLNYDVDLYVPKFKLEQTINLKQTLSAMCVEDFFTAAADLTGISANGNLSASGAFHRTFVEVNEEGNEAAGASSIEISCECAAEEQTVLLIDRPFMFLICSSDPEAVLFMGAVRRI
ncbi:iris-like [Dermacentor variabilis]|uniref:iris-like n=1 Tax=Dermacentor variabilis TaxID=34621 RepID=UPI003F5BDF67